MRESVARFNARTRTALDVIAVPNDYLGREITVSGLLSGHDLLAVFGGQTARSPLYISDRMLSQRTGTLLDDRTIEDVAAAIGRPIVVASDLTDVARDLRSRRRREAEAAA
jgi:NifB/MoaA-like Fe-S oxidoreductase